MIYQLDNIEKDVRICLDQNADVSSLLGDGDEDTLRLNDVIRSKVPEAVERVHLSAPCHLLEQGHDFSQVSVWNNVSQEYELQDNSICWTPGDTCGYILLPDDFMRLVAFRMSDWERAVYTAITPSDTLYIKQRSRVRGIRGTSQRPVVAVCVHPAGRVLEFYSCKTGYNSSDPALTPTISSAVYIPYPRIEKDNDREYVDISELCYTAVVHTVAALTLITFNEAERATVFNEMAKTYLER